MTKNISYLVVGTGGVGGSIAGFLALAGKEVTCIARGAHLQAIRERGLKLQSTLKGTHYLKIPAYTSEEFTGKADVIFVCVKGYSIGSVAGLIQKASHKDTLIIPILNVYGTGDKIQTMLEDGRAIALDGCVYIVSFVSAPGEITQMGQIFRLVYGVRKGTVVPLEKIQAVQADLIESGIKAVISEDINRDTFIKWSFISAMALTGAYFNVPMREIQRAGEERDVFIGLSTESAEVGQKLNIPVPDDLVAYSLNILDNLDPDSTASLQKDIAKGHESEIDDLLFNMIRMAGKAGVKTPVYLKVAEKFRSLPDPNVVSPVPNIDTVTYVKPTIKNKNILVGDFTYFSDVAFEDHVTHFYDFYNDKLIIGKFCQIASGVEFIMNGANHQMDCASTFPFYIFEKWNENVPPLDKFPLKGDTIVGNDVWIGQDTVILPGIKIGDGAIIGMKSVVGRDVEPYTIVAGNPAKVIRKRFDDEIIELMLKLKWWDLSVEEIIKLIPLLHDNNMENVKKKIREVLK